MLVLRFNYAIAKELYKQLHKLRLIECIYLNAPNLKAMLLEGCKFQNLNQ